MNRSVLRLAVVSLFLLVVFSLNARGLNDSVRNNVNNDISKRELIAKQRELLLDYFVEKSSPEILVQLERLNTELSQDRYIGIYVREKWILQFYLKNYSLLASEVKKFVPSNLPAYYDKIKPKDDQLFEVLLSWIQANSGEVEQSLKNTLFLKSEEKDLLLVLLKSYTIKSKDYRAEMNILADDFLKSYPKGDFDEYVRNYVRYKYEPQGFLFGSEFYSGASILSSNANSLCEDGGVLGFGLILGYSRITLNLRGAFVFSSLSTDINSNSYVWQKGAQCQLFLPEAVLGYDFPIKEKFYVSPLLGYGGFSLAPYENDKKENPVLNDISIDSYGLPSVGFELGWLFINQFRSEFSTVPRLFYSLNLRYMYQPIVFTTKYNEFNGGVHNISLSLKLGVGKGKRVY